MSAIGSGAAEDFLQQVQRARLARAVPGPPVNVKRAPRMISGLLAPILPQVGFREYGQRLPDQHRQAGPVGEVVPLLCRFEGLPRPARRQQRPGEADERLGLRIPGRGLSGRRQGLAPVPECGRDVAGVDLGAGERVQRLDLGLHVAGVPGDGQGGPGQSWRSGSPHAFPRWGRATLR